MQTHHGLLGFLLAASFGSTASVSERSTKISDPPNYSLAYGPLDAAVEARSYLRNQTLDTYDVKSCADLCSSATPDRSYGLCKSFNIFKSKGGDTDPSYTCSLFAEFTNSTEATLPSDGFGRTVVASRGYSRKNLVVNSIFKDNHDGWNYSGNTHYAPYSGHVHQVEYDGDYSTTPDERGCTVIHGNGSFKPRKALKTTKGKRYVLQYFLGAVGTKPPGSFYTRWNNVMLHAEKHIDPAFKLYYFTTPPAKGNDTFELEGKWIDGIGTFYIDDVYVFPA